MQLGKYGRFLSQSPALFLYEALAPPFAMEISHVIAARSVTSKYSGLSVLPPGHPSLSLKDGMYLQLSYFLS